MYTVHCTIYIVHCTVYSVHFTVYSAQDAVHRNSAQDAPFNYTDNDFTNKVLNPEEIFTTVTKTADLLTGAYYIMYNINMHKLYLRIHTLSFYREY